MKILLVLAHPEPASLNTSIYHFIQSELVGRGHDVQVSDLYSMEWKTAVDRGDFADSLPGSRLRVARASSTSFANGALTEDVRQEHKKLLWADAVIFQFPLWWFSMPAILKGWFDRVYSCGFAYGVGEHSDKRWGDRYGEGMMKGKRAMLVVTAGGWESHYASRGVNGDIHDLLFPINHGMLFYPGFDVLPPFIVYQADRTSEASFEEIRNKLRETLLHIADQTPIPYRCQNGGDYIIPAMTLREGIERKGTQGNRIHLRPQDLPGRTVQEERVTSA